MRTGIFLPALVVWLLMAANVQAADERGTNHDTHPLSRAEIDSFLPLVCSKPSSTDHPEFIGPAYDCAAFIGYDGQEENGTGEVPNGTAPGSISLQAIVYGSFSATAEDEAYVTYFSSREAHSLNFGGGILFKRTENRWQLVHWYPGGQMGQCIGLPGNAPQSLLCLDGYVGMGEVDSSVWVKHVPSMSENPPFQDVSILKAQDDREAIAPGEPDSYPCKLGGPSHKAMLLKINDLERSENSAEIAVSHITYATAQDVQIACAKRHFESVNTTDGVVHYVIENGKITAKTAFDFANTDY
jgi:hypothetical protein